MINTTKIKDGLSIYDYSNIFLGGFDNIITLIQLNPQFVNMDADLSDFVTQYLTYDDAYFEDRTIQIQLSISAAPPTIKYLQSVSGQSLYDLNLATYSGFDNLINFCQDNNINNTNVTDLGLRSFKFDTTLNLNLSLSAVVKNKGYVFVSAKNATTIGAPSFLLLETGDFLLLETGDKIIL